MATSLSGTESTAWTYEFYDVFGRLEKVTEPSEGVQALYDYDEGNRLHHVELVNNTNHQHRWFSYDGLGFLRSETHPEKGATGNGSVTYGDYDAKGHAGYRYDTTAARGVEFNYDSAERLTDVNETSQAGGRPLKQFTFDTAAGYGLGKLATATGWTYSPASGIYPDVKVTESYTYSGREGRISAKSTQVNENGIDTERYDQAFTWSPGGELVSETYPQCFNGACGATGQSHFNSTSTYAHGYPTATGGFITGITYHESGMVAAVTHSDGTVDTIEEDSYGKARPGRIHADLGATNLFDTGSFAYDGSGNIEAMGGNHYRYDGVSRLAQAQIVLPSGTYDQSYDVDPFGNLQAITTTPAGGSATIRNTPTNRDTNRLTSAVYDAGGNATSLLGNAYTYDVLNRMVRNQSGGEDWFFAYTADDERIEMIRNGGGGKVSTLRGLDSQVLRETHLELPGTPYSDLIRWNGKLGTKKDSAGLVTHYHLDHLGTPRILTDATGAITAGYDYYPYGEEIVTQESTERMRFTGHERDVLGTTSGSNFTADDLDYMHARHNSPLTGRFLSVDIGAPKYRAPQSWNRYSYAQANPVKFLDPNGLEVKLSTAGNSQELKGMVVLMITKPSGREYFMRLAKDPAFKVSLGDSRINSAAQIRAAQSGRANGQLVAADTTALNLKIDGKQVLGALIRIDTEAVKAGGPDTSGVRTMAHETYHAVSIQEGVSPEELRAQDLPSNDKGTAEKFGEKVQNEQPDMTQEEAEEILNELLSGRPPV